MSRAEKMKAAIAVEELSILWHNASQIYKLGE